jgi:Flp pilus assembly protein TadB
MTAAQKATHTSLQVVEELLDLTVGATTVFLPLFILALPCVVLVVLPVLVVGAIVALVGGVVAAVLAPAFLLFRAVRRRFDTP